MRMDSLPQSIKHGKGKRHLVEVPEDIIDIRNQLNLSQSAFSGLLGGSTRALQDWEQGRPALSLLRIAKEHPEVLIVN